VQKGFKDIENEFHELLFRLKQKDISEREFKDRLKRLRFEDSKGRCWTIGARSGKWYYFDGKKWIESRPPSIQDKKAICIYCGFENDLESEVCAGCGGNLVKEENFKQKTDYVSKDKSKEIPSYVGADNAFEKEEKEKLTRILQSFSPVSVLLFFGIAGIFFGSILGVFTGATDYFLGIVKILPSFLQSINGNLIRGVFYGLLGGISGFLILGIFGFILAVFINVILSFFGGIKIRIE